MERIHKSGNDKMLAGVCGGLAEYFAVDPVLLRIGFVVVTLMWGAGLLVYLALAVIMPTEADAALPSSERVRRNLDDLSDEMRERAEQFRRSLDEDDHRRRNTFAGLLVLAGVVFLAGQWGWYPHLAMQWLAPLLLIALGIAVFAGVFQRPPR